MRGQWKIGVRQTPAGACSGYVSTGLLGWSVEEVCGKSIPQNGVGGKRAWGQGQSIGGFLPGWDHQIGSASGGAGGLTPPTPLRLTDGLDQKAGAGQ
jgi:hypothetical protein